MLDDGVCGGDECIKKESNSELFDSFGMKTVYYDFRFRLLDTAPTSPGVSVEMFFVLLLRCSCGGVNDSLFLCSVPTGG